MDVAGLRHELEQHLGKNPHEDAPDGFRDRFDAVVDEMESGSDHVPREMREAQLRRICDEAEAAAAAGRTEADSAPAPEPRPGARDVPAGPSPDRTDTKLPAEADQGAPGRRLVPLVLLVIIIVAAYFVLR